MQGTREDDAEARFTALQRDGKSMTEFAASVMKWGRLAKVPEYRQVRTFKAALMPTEILFVFAHPQVTAAAAGQEGITMDLIMDVANVYQNLYSASATGQLEAQRATQRGVLLTPSVVEEDLASIVDRGDDGERQGLLAIQRSTDRWTPPPISSRQGGGGVGAPMGALPGSSVVAPSSVGPSASVAPGAGGSAEALARQMQEMANSQRQFQELMEKRWQEMQSRATPRRGCYHCGHMEHRSGQCPQRGDRWGPGACMNCGVGGHLATACPHPRRTGPLVQCAWFVPSAGHQ